MLKKALSFIILIFLLNNLIYAEPINVYDEWVESGDSFKLGDFKFQPIYSDDTVVLKIDDKSVDINLGQCRTSDPFSICFNDTRLVKDGKVVPDDINDPNVDTEMLLVIDGLLAELEISRIFEATTILQNEIVEVLVTIENIGDEDATDVFYSDKFPKEFRLQNAVDCKIIDDDEISWTGTIRKEKSHKCQFEIVALEEKEYTSKATVEYFNAMEEEDDYDSQKLSIPKPYIEISLDTSTSKPVPGDTITLDIILINNFESDLKINNLHVGVPKNLKIIEAGEIDENNKWHGDIIDNLEFNLEMQAIKTGEIDIIITVEYELDGFELSIIEDKRIIINNDLKIDIIENINEMALNKDNLVNVKISNPNDKILYNLRTEITSDMPGFEKVIQIKDNLGRNNNFIVFDEPIKPETEGEYFFNISVDFENEFGERFINSHEERIIVSSTAGVLTKVENEQASRTENEPAATTSQNKSTMIPDLDFSGKTNKSRGIIILAIVLIAGLIFFLIRYITHSY